MDIVNLDKSYIVPSYPRQNAVFVRGEGEFLYDADGREYIDFGSGIAVNGLGIKNEKWLGAVVAQLNMLPHVSNIYYSEPQAKLARLLCERTGFKKVFFSNSGAEANECAIKCARKYSYERYGKNRYKILTLEGSFHGRTMATITATGQENFHTYFMPFLEGFDYAKANIESVKEKLTDEFCAVMVELCQGEGGVNPLDKGFVKELEKFCKERDILMIVDEVQTGNGRTGALYAYMLYEIAPDIVTTAKGLGNGLPIGATMFSEKTADVLTAGTHGSTFGGNPLACAGAYAVIEQITDELLLGVQKRRDIIIKELGQLNGVKSITGLGLMLGIECGDAKKIQSLCLERGLAVLTAKDKVRLLPALNIGEEALYKGLNILKGVINETSSKAL